MSKLESLIFSEIGGNRNEIAELEKLFTALNNVNDINGLLQLSK
jgi:hypothetical protein